MANEKIKKEVVDNLYWDTRVDATDVVVEVSDDGEVTLTGNVPSYTAKTSATTSVWSISGVKEVDNQLTVEYPAAVTVPSDQDIRNNVENTLLWDTDIDSTKIDVSVNAGVVTIEGDVDAYWKLYQAQSDADVTGVLDIVNKLAVVPSEDILDKDIAEDVINALDRNAMVDIDNVNVEVEDGDVVLTGAVSDWSAYRSAEDTAFYTLGVTSVDNQLTIA